jgi:outer membrane receptor protein involved in Fe transport
MVIFGFKRTVVWLLASAAIAAAVPARAQDAPIINYNIPAQDLGKSLTDFARQSNREIYFSSDLTRGKQAPKIRGQLSTDQALQQLLAGSGLTYKLDASGAFTIVRDPGNGKSAPEGASFDQNNTAITVTGTRIRGAGSASPVNVTTRRDLEQAGINDLADLTRILPQNYAGGQNRGIAGNGEQGGQLNLNDSSQLNLRGLGPDATLTLLNGHRLSYDGISQGVDIASIPVSAIERIEVVADGASALYGSDAVGGVANIILRRDYEGLETTARAGAATDGGDVQQQYSLVGGRRWSSGGFILALDHEFQTPITAAQRDYTSGYDPSFWLTDRIKQTSAVLAANEQIAPGLHFDLDGTLMQRHSLQQDPYTSNNDVHIDGQVARERTLSYSISPTVRAGLGPWQASLSTTLAKSRIQADANNYASGVAQQVGRLLFENNLKGAEVTAEGPLIRLPGGEARLALGGGVREISLHLRRHILSPSGAVSFKEWTERRKTQFAYGEVSLPLIGPEQHLTLVDRLTLSGAVRHEHWAGIDTVTTPKFGVIYQPVPDVTLRATWGKSFKIPTLQQVNQPQQAILIPGFIFSPLPQPPGAPVLLLTGGSPNLKPERATTWSGTVEVKPQFVPALHMRATYFHINYRDRLATPFTSVLSALYNPLYDDFITYNPSASDVNALIATIPGGLTNQTGAPFDPAGIGAIVDTSLRNSERQRIHGVDLDADYRLDLGRSGKLLLTGSASYLHSDQQLSKGQPFQPLAGTIFHPPHWRGRAGLTWDRGGQSLSAFVNYVGPNTDNVLATLRRVSAFTTVDLTAALRTQARTGPLHNVELRLVALNVLNQKPHVIRIVYPSEAPYDSTNESPVGRFLGVSLRKVW